MHEVITFQISRYLNLNYYFYNDHKIISIFEFIIITYLIIAQYEVKIFTIIGASDEIEYQYLLRALIMS